MRGIGGEAEKPRSLPRADKKQNRRPGNPVGGSAFTNGEWVCTYFLVPRMPRAAALRRFIRVFLMSATLRASTSSEFLRMVSQ